MLDGELVRAVLDSRDAYDRVAPHLHEGDLSLQAETWMPLIRDWYKADPKAQSVDIDMLKTLGEKRLPEQHLDTLIGWIDGLREVASPVNVVTTALELKRYRKGNELCAAIQGRRNDIIDNLLEEFEELRRATELGNSKVQWTNDNEEMASLLNRENLIKVAPKRVNEKLKGGSVPGDTILIFGRPEAGKTLFTVNMVAGFLRMGKTVLYVGNEESTYKTRKRIACNLSNTESDAFDDEALARAETKGLSNLWMCHMEPGSMSEVEEIAKDLRPDVVVIDQIRNLDAKGRGAEKLTDRLGVLATQFRSAANRHQFLGIAVTQAGDKTERHGQEVPAWLSMSDIADNRTSLAAQFDVILGVGCTEELRRSGSRAISFCKNKNSDEDDAHEGLIVQVDVKRSKVR